MQSRRASQTRGAEEQHLRRQEDEELGRIAWVASTRSGLNLPGATTASLRALGAKMRGGSPKASVWRTQPSAQRLTQRPLD